MNYQTIKTKRKTSLTDNSFLRYITSIVLYCAQGVPEGMLSFGIPAWMVMNGKSPGEIAGFAVVTVLPWSFKFIVAPLMDRYNYLPMGRKRPWILLGQIGLLVSCIYLAYIPEPLNNIDQLMIAGFFVSFFGAFQDVATDGMAVDIIPADQQAKANGLMWGSKIIGMSLSLALGSWLLNKYNFTIAILMMAVAIGIIMLVPLFLRERQGEKIVPWTSGEASPLTKNLQIESWRHIFKSLFSVFRLRNSLIIALVLFISQGGFKYVSTLLPIFTVKELSWTNVDYSNYFASAKLVGGIVGMLIGGLLIDKFGKKRMMNFYFLSSIFLIMTLVLSKSYWPSRNFIFAFMITQNILYTFASIGILPLQCNVVGKSINKSIYIIHDNCKPRTNDFCSFNWTYQRKFQLANFTFRLCNIYFNSLAIITVFKY
ncbi:MAG: MFS transporter [Bacteroidetes bacterium]|nr:MFS transporter [Bacteroidota bacterium]